MGAQLWNSQTGFKLKKRTLWMAEKSVPQNHLSDAHKWTTIHILQKQLSICTHTVVITIF